MGGTGGEWARVVLGWGGLDTCRKKLGCAAPGEREREREDGEELKAARRWDAGVNDGCLSCRRDEQLTAN